MECIYTTNLNLTEENVASVLLTAHHLQMVAMVLLCEEFIIDHISQTNFLTYMKLAERYEKLLVHVDKFQISNIQGQLIIIPFEATCAHARCLCTVGSYALLSVHLQIMQNSFDPYRTFYPANLQSFAGHFDFSLDISF